jgi:HEAT repeat protein
MSLSGILVVISFAVPVGAERGVLAADEALPRTAQQPNIQKLIDNLKSDDPRTLHEALQGLGRPGPEVAGTVSALAGLLADDRRFTYRSGNIMGRTSFQVNVAAVMALRNIRKPAVPVLVTALDNKDSNVRQLAAQSLAEIGEPIEPKQWIRALADSNRYVQIIAARQLGKGKEVSGVDSLCKALKDEDAYVRIEAAKALGQIGDTKAIDPLIAAVSDANVNVMASARVALAQLGRAAVPALLDRLNRSKNLDGRARSSVARAIIEAEPTQMRELLLQWLKSEHCELRAIALSAMIGRRLPEALEAAKAMAADADWGVRWTAVRGLGELADDQTAEAIRPMLLKVLREDEDSRVRVRALRSLYFFADKSREEFWKTINAAMGDESPAVREAAVAAAGKFWNPKLAPALRNLLKDAAPNVRAEAILLFGSRDTEAATTELVRILADEDPRCAEYAAYALGKRGTDEAVETLIRTVWDSRLDLKLRNAAVAGLCQSKNPKTIGPLIDALQDKALRQNAVRMETALKELTGQDFRSARDWRKWYEQQRGAEPR